MLSPRAVPSTALLRSLRNGQPCHRVLRSTTGGAMSQNARLHNSSRRAEKKDFRGQLFESTIQRVEQERQQQRKLAAERAGASKGGPAGMTVVILVATAVGYYLGTFGNETLPTTSTLPLDQTIAPKHNVGKSNLEAAWTDFVNIVGKDNVTTDPLEAKAHSGSSWSSYNTKDSERPFLVVFPNSTEEVSKIMKVCYERKIPVTAYTGGTSLEGHFAATRGGICIDFNRMNKILELHKEDLDVIVQPAVGWQDLNEDLSEQGLFFPPDPGPGAMIGGMVGTGCSGTNAYRYGTMKEWVTSLTVVLADGTVIKTRQRPRKSSAGYDLTRVFIGSEGTLGLVTEATLRLTTKPKNSSVAVTSFNSIREAADCVAKVVDNGVPIAAVELLDDEQMKCINLSGSTSKSWKEAPTLFFKFGGTAAGVKEQVGIVQKLAKSSGSKSFEFARSDDEAAELWSARKEALWSVMAQKRDDSDHVWTTDVAVPISKLPEIVEQTKKDMAKSGLLGTIVGHVGDGNFHSIILFNDKERNVAEGVVHRMVKRAVELEGTVTGEHGVGLVKRDYLEHELGRETVDAMRKLKQAFDPLCLLNCDKIVRTQRPKPGEVNAW